MSAFVADVVARAENVRRQLLQDEQCARYIDPLVTHIPRPYLGGDSIRIVIIGQDPTVQQVARRQQISTVLMLNEPKRILYRYVRDLCARLGVGMDQVYATNACKCFFTDPPTTIKKRDKVDVLKLTAEVWLPVLRSEMAAFPDAVVISLGEPVLPVLVKAGASPLMRHYWGYRKDWQQRGFLSFFAVTPDISAVDRLIYPYIHQPSLRGRAKAFYSARMVDYITTIRAQLSATSAEGLTIDSR